MRRGEVWTVASGEAYAGKPRPAVIVQADDFDKTDSIIICGLTSTGAAEVPLPRPEVAPNAENGLLVPSRVMIDKIIAVPKRRLRRHIGLLGADDMDRITRSMALVLGMSSRS